MQDRERLVQRWFESSLTVQRAWKAKFYQEMGDQSMSIGQLTVMFYLSEHQPATSKRIAAELHHSKSSVAQLLDSLEQSGFIVRAVDEHDRRVSHISLSQDGQDRVSELETRRRSLFVDVAEGLSDDELEVMIAVQRKMIAQLGVVGTDAGNAHERKDVV